jgi:hypothetical protein
VKDKSIRAIFWAMVAVFIIIICAVFLRIPLADSLSLGLIFLPGIAIFLLLGVALIVLIIKMKVGGRFKDFLLLAGASAVGLPVFVVLHNLVTALIINIFRLRTNFDEPVFFILATIVCPLGFLVGAVGTIVLTVKNKSGQLAI